MRRRVGGVVAAVLLSLLPVGARPAAAHTNDTYKIGYDGRIVVDRAVFQRAVAAT